MSSEFSIDDVSVPEDILLSPSNKESVSRLEWIDCSKGVGVIFVVLVHSIIPIINPITHHLSSFTMPIFFILAGLTYNNNRHRSAIKPFASSRAQQFLIPYVCIYVAEILLLIPLSAIIAFPLNAEQLSYWFLYGAGPPNAATHLWFLPVVYFSLMIFVLLDRILQKTPHILRWIIFMALPINTILINSYFSPNLVPWRIGIILLTTSFVFIGNEMRRIRGLKTWSTKSRILDVLVFIILACILLLVSEFNGFTDVALDNYGVNVWLYLCTGTIGTILVFMLSNAIISLPSIKHVFLAYGDNSQEVYEVHPPLFYLVPIFIVLLGGTTEDYLTLFPDLWFIRFILGIGLSIFISIKIIKKNKLLRIIFKGRSAI